MKMFQPSATLKSPSHIINNAVNEAQHKSNCATPRKSRFRHIEIACVQQRNVAVLHFLFAWMFLFA